MLFNPKKAEREPWEMFFIGLLYAGLSVLIVDFMFAEDTVLSNYLGVLVVTFSVMFSLPFMYYLIKYEEEKDLKYSGMVRILEENSKAIRARLWRLLGFIVACSVGHIALPTNNTLEAQIETYCSINQPRTFDSCLREYGIGEKSPKITSYSSKERAINIFSNNMIVLIITLLFSLVFGAGAIFILAWNASVIAAAIGIFTEYSLIKIPYGLLRYMIHGIPEIGAYIIVALAGGIVGTAIIRHDADGDKFWDIVQDSLNLIILAIIVLVAAALIEVYITPIII